VVNSVRLLLAGVLIAAAQAGVYWIDRGWTPSPASPPHYDPEAWPLEMGAWHGQPIEPDQTGGAVICGNWLYRNSVGAQISLLVGAWTNYTVVLPHSPESCYRAAGWKPMSVKDVEVPVPGGQPISARIVFYERETERVAVMFWYHFGDKVLRDNEELRHLQQGLRGKATALPPAIKIMLHTSAFDVDQVESRLTEFASLVAAETTKIH
jgi:hypothetical protein